MASAVAVRGKGACLDPATLHLQIARWLERETVDARIAVDVVFGPGDRDVRFSVSRRHGPSAERVLEGLPEACDARLAAVGLSIALAIDAAILEVQRLPDDEELLEVKPRPGLLDRLRPEVAPHHFSLALSAAAGVSTGLVTATAPVATVSLHGLISPWVELRIGGIFASASGQRLPEVMDVEYGATVWAGRADLCLHIPVASWLAALGCAGAQAGAFTTEASGAGLQRSSRVVRPLWAIGLGMSARASLTSVLEIAASVDLSLPLADRVIEVQDANGEAADSRELLPAGMFVSLGPVVRFF